MFFFVVFPQADILVRDIISWGLEEARGMLVETVGNSFFQIKISLSLANLNFVLRI